MGKIIVIEGTDSSGKQTQSEILFENLKNQGKNVKKISFPNYESPACEPVKMYLAGEFGKNPSDVNPYSISAMYAIDRYASFKKDWERFYKEEGIIVTDRYTTSNMVHQASKIENFYEKRSYLQWLYDLEYKKMGIPEPDLVIFLNMPPDAALKLMSERNNKITGKKEKDIHEADAEYLKKSHENACEVSKIENWNEVMCTGENGRIKSIEEISKEIYEIILKKDII